MSVNVVTSSTSKSSKGSNRRYYSNNPHRCYGNRLVEQCVSALVLLLSMLGSVSARSPRNHGRMLCSEVHSKCFGRSGCRFALENYFISCLDLSEGPEFECTDRCKEALIMLLSSDEHDGPNAFRDCDCQEDEFCLQQKQRITVCADDVQQWLTDINDPLTPISCSLAEKVCSADTPCLAAIEYYQDHCKKLLEPHNPRCTSRCNNSLNILYRQTKAQKLRTCLCNGREMYNCTNLKDNTQNLCYGGSAATPRHDTSTRPLRHPHSHDHTRGCGHPPTPRAPIDNFYDSDKEALSSSPSGSCHDSAQLNTLVAMLVTGYVLSSWR